MSQGDLFDGDRAYDDGTYPSDFWEWLERNRHIYEAFVHLALRARRRGINRWSARSLIEILRWRTALKERTETSSLKINDHCVPGLARLAMAKIPDLEGFFQTRTPPATAEARRLKDGRLYSEPEDPEEPDE